MFTALYKSQLLFLQPILSFMTTVPEYNSFAFHEDLKLYVIESFPV